MDEHPELREDRLIRLPEVCRLTGLSKSTIYRLIGQGRFPNSVNCSDRGVAWRELEVRDWIRARDRMAPGAL